MAVAYGKVILAPTEEQVLQHIQDMKDIAVDRHIESDALRCRIVVDAEDNTTVEYMISKQDGPMQLEYTHTAFSQLLNRKRVPVNFYERCSSDLKQRIFNEHVRRGSDLLLRLLKDNKEQPAADAYMVRAVLSDRYGVKDDHEVFPVVLDALKDQDFTIRSYMYDDRITQMLIEFTDAKAHYNSQDHVAGILISNSETGQSSIWCEPVVTIPGCHFVNRASLRSQGVDCRVVHRGEIEQARIHNMALQAKEIAQVGIVQLAESWNEKISAGYALSFAKGIDSLPKRMFDILEEEWKNEEEVIKAEAARRIILMAQELPLFQRIQTQQATGKLLGLFNNYKSRMAAILEEINE